MAVDHIVTCECGRVIPVECDKATRHNKAGTGYYASKDITKLNRTHALVLIALERLGASNLENGKSRWEVYEEVKELCTVNKLRTPTPSGISGRLSEMQGPDLRITKCERNEVELIDPASMKFRYKSRQVWFLAEQPTLRAFQMVEDAKAEFWRAMEAKLQVKEVQA